MSTTVTIYRLCVDGDMENRGEVRIEASDWWNIATNVHQSYTRLFSMPAAFGCCNTATAFYAFMRM